MCGVPDGWSMRNQNVLETYCFTGGADKALARPARKQATATEDFDFHITYL